MKKHFICIKVLFFLNLMSFSNIFAQQVGNDAFLKGQYLEVGIAKSGSFGTEGIAPSGYNANVNGKLGFVADPARDGFNVGSPSYTGDFFLPGSPEEGWGLTINGADYFNGTRVSRQDIAGSIVNYSNTATDVSATWTGNKNGLEITQTVSFPKNALYFIIQVKIKNTSTSTVPGIYYMRNVDPDNEQRWGGGYSTRNSIIQQPPNSNCNTGLVEAVGTNFGMYLGLGTKDARAKVTFGGFANRSASNIWNGVSLSQSGSLTADQAISIAYNIGNLAPEQETKLTYAYVLGQDELTDALDATAEAKFFAGEVDITSEDSYTNCPGNQVTLSVSNINNYTWTWSGGDLSPTSGSSVIVNPESNTVYTVVGNPISSSSTCGFGTITRSITVNVMDEIEPQVFTKPITITLDENGYASITGSDINDESNDTCGISSIVASKTSFDCSNIGPNTVSLTVTDVNGNSASADAIVTVEDATTPVAITQDITVQLDVNGVANILPSDIDNGSNDACGVTLAVSQSNFDCSHVGANTVTLTVTDANANVSTIDATVTVEDATAPVAIAQEITVQLDVNGVASILPSDIDNDSNDACGVTLAVSQSDFDCSHVGANTVTLTVTDSNTNVTTIDAIVTVEDNIAPVAIAQDITVQLDVNGVASILPSDIDNGSNDACGVTLAVSQSDFDCSHVGANTVTLTVTDANANVSTIDATVTVEDATAPVAIAQDITVQLDVNGVASILPSDIDNGSNDACGVTLALSKVDFDCSNVGTNTVTLTVTDANANVSTIDAIVTVEDATDPVAIAQDITVQLDVNGVASILPSDIDNGSNDACGVTLALSKVDFDCSNVGANTVTLTVTDSNTNVTTIDAIVTVEDNITPVAIAQDITIQLDVNGVASIVPSDIDNGSNDACGVTLALSKVDFDCSHVGANTVTLKVTDANTNVSTIDAIVTVEDATAPEAIAQDITVQLDVNGVASIVPSDIDNGSNDACGVTLALSKVDFDCSHVGANTVTLTVTDANENVSTIDAIVTVEDATAPVAIAQDITVQLDANGNASITAAQLDNDRTMPVALLV